jgi:predicted membrane-bound mannosyltransferase
MASSPILYYYFYFSYSSMFSSRCYFLATNNCFLGELSSPLPSLAYDEIVQLHKLFGIWVDGHELVRNLASLLAAPTIFFYMLTIFIYAHCVYDAFMIHVLDQMMIDTFLRPLLLLLLIFSIYWCFIGLVVYMLLEETHLKWSAIGCKSPLGVYGLVVPLCFLRPSRISKAHFLASIRTKHEISRIADSATRCPKHEPTYEEEELEDQLTQRSLMMSYKRI